MKSNPLREFGTTAQSLSRNPLGIIALFIVLVYGLACIVLITSRSLSENERLPLIYFLIIFPLVVLGVFTYLVAFRSGQLFAPSDFRNEEHYVELQRMRTVAIASLAVGKRLTTADVNIADVARSVDSVVTLSQEGANNPTVLWVDDNPQNNTFIKQAFESVGIQVVLSERTSEALDTLEERPFGAVISDMGRREGPREGYALLDALRERGDETPLFFYAGSSDPEHKRETREHGGQGSTNDGQELFEMVTRVIFGSQPARRVASVNLRQPRSRRVPPGAA
jgi:CheY-like chemotaxis protein